MTSRIKATGRKIFYAAAVVTDWLLISSGLLLTLLALTRIDLPLAKWPLLGCGFFFSGAGCRYRQGRKKTRQPEA